MTELLITESEFEEARGKTDDMWTDYEVFEEERDPVDLHELVKRAVESQYTHPQGPDSLYGMSSSTQGLIDDLVHSSSGELVPTTLPKDVLDKFARELSSEVEEYSEAVYKKVKKEIDPENDDVELSEIREVMNTHTEQIVPETF